jgi:trans-aconitate methyltransferase
MDDVADLLIERVRPHLCLDLGAGAGKYGRILRRLCPTAHLRAVEVEQQYIDEFALLEIYDEVICSDATDLIASDIDRSYDLVVIGDCLEHMRKSDGLDLLNFLVYRCKYMLAVYPIRWLQGSWQGHASEAHISVWGAEDFAWVDHVSVHRDPFVAVVMNGFLLPEDDELKAQHVLRELL